MLRPTFAYRVRFGGDDAAKLPRVLRSFARWLARQPYGSVGAFDLEARQLGPDALAFATLPKQQCLALNAHGEVVLLWRGRAVLIPLNIEEFITRLAEADTGVFSLDIGDHAGRKQLATWWRLALYRRSRHRVRAPLPKRFLEVTERPRSAVRPRR